MNEWIRVDERMPETGVPVIAYYKNQSGNSRRIRAAYAGPKSLEADLESDFGEYDEEADTYWCPEGWYEQNEYEETHWQVDETVTHWMPLPEPPKNTQP
jgi:hypothetical protein